MQRDRQVWVFNAVHFQGNPKWLFLHVLRHRADIEAWWLADDADQAATVRDLGLPAVAREDADAAAIMQRAGVWVVNQVKEVIPPELRGVVMLNLWHGVGVKNIERSMTEGYLLERIARKYVVNSQAYHDTQLFLVSSPLMESHFAAQVGLE
ncbi:MAG: hypothetical protein EON52_13990, partial [Actinomycetales bacterium]